MITDDELSQWSVLWKGNNPVPRLIDEVLQLKADLAKAHKARAEDAAEIEHQRTTVIADLMTEVERLCAENDRLNKECGREMSASSIAYAKLAKAVATLEGIASCLAQFGDYYNNDDHSDCINNARQTLTEIR